MKTPPRFPFRQSPAPNFEQPTTAVILAAVSGQVILKTDSALTLMSMTIQVSADCDAQVMELGQPLTIPFTLKANTIWSLPSRYVPNNARLILLLTAGTAKVEAVYRPGINPQDLTNHEHQFFRDGGDSFAVSNFPAVFPPAVLLPTYLFAMPDTAANFATQSTFVFYGSASKLVKIYRLAVSIVGNVAAAGFEIDIKRYSTQPTGGTAVSLLANIAKADSNDAASTVALIQRYTAAPTDGTLAGFVATWRTIFPSTTAPAQGSVDLREILFGGSTRKPLTLRNQNEGIGIAFSNFSLNYTCDVEWTEE